MELVQLNRGHYKAFISMAKDFEKSGYLKYSNYTTKSKFIEYLDKIDLFLSEDTVPKGYVLSKSYWLIDNGVMLGGIRFRPKLTPELLIEGGHIGYDIRPSYRNMGYATKMLEMLLIQLKKADINKVLVTCFIDNIASERVILNNKGVFDSMEVSPRTGKMTKRFFIEV